MSPLIHFYHWPVDSHRISCIFPCKQRLLSLLTQFIVVLSNIGLVTMKNYHWLIMVQKRISLKYTEIQCKIIFFALSYILFIWCIQIEHKYRKNSSQFPNSILSVIYISNFFSPVIQYAYSWVSQFECLSIVASVVIMKWQNQKFSLCFVCLLSPTNQTISVHRFTFYR